MKKLISMTDYVLNVSDPSYLEPEEMQQAFQSIHAYAQFLKTPLELGMFVPCDKHNNILEEPKVTDKRYNQETVAVFRFIEEAYNYDVKIYNQAKERVIFEGVKVVRINDYYVVSNREASIWLSWNKTKEIEDLMPYNLLLTQNAIKKYGL